MAFVVCAGEIFCLQICFSLTDPERQWTPCGRLVGPERSCKWEGPRAEEKWLVSLLSKGKDQTTVENPEVAGHVEGI